MALEFVLASGGVYPERLGGPIMDAPRRCLRDACTLIRARIPGFSFLFLVLGPEAVCR